MHRSILMYKSMVFMRKISFFLFLFISLRLFSFNSSLNPDSLIVPCSVPSIIIQPQSKTICSNDSVSFYIDATDSEILNYQWQKDGVNITSATNSKYSIYNTDFNDAGEFLCFVWNDCGKDSSRTAFLKLYEFNPPAIIISNSDTICAGSNHIIFLAGPRLNKYQWYRDDKPINGATNNYLEINNASIIDSGNYYCIADFGPCNFNVQSDKSRLTVNPIPVIMLPKDTTINTGQTLNLDAGMENISYRWSSGEQSESIKITGRDLGLGKHKFTITVTNNQGCSSSDTVNVKVISQLFSISGNVKYYNSKIYLNKAKIILYDLEHNKIDSTFTNNKGEYFFTNIPNGLYVFKTFTNTLWGGSDPLDALFVNRYFIQVYNFSDIIAFNAADVNADNVVNPIDALIINRRFVNIINSFLKQDWIFDNDTITIDGNDVIYNYNAICTGDVDGSYFR